MGSLAGFFLDDDIKDHLMSYGDCVKKASGYNPHITLFYFSDEDINLNPIKTIFDTETRRLRKTKNYSFEANVTGIARFRTESGSTDPIVALIDCPAVYEYRLQIKHRLEDSNIYYESLFTPHITIGYVSKNYDAKIPKIKKYDFQIDQLTLCSKTESFRYEV